MTTGSDLAGPTDPGRATEALAERMRRDVTGALELYTVYLGQRLGLYQALAGCWNRRARS